MDPSSVVSAFEANSFKFQDSSLAEDVAAAAVACGFTSSSDVGDEYEAFMFQRPKVVDLVTRDLVDAFRTYLNQNRKGKENNSGQMGFRSRSDFESLATVITPTKTPGAQKAKRKASLEDLKTPAAARNSPASVGFKTPASVTASLLVPTPNTSFRQRTQSGKLQAQLNPELPTPALGSEADGLVAETVGPVLATEARYMSDTLRSKALHIESRILKFVAALEAAGGPSATTPVNVPAQEPVWVAGRVVCDSDGRLNTKSVLLEGSIRDSGGNRVRLDVSQVASYSLLPGQIIAVEGLNPDGNAFIATRIVSGVPAEAKERPEGEDTEMEDATEVKERQQGPEPRMSVEEVEPHSVVIACGPFTTSENLAYEPLKELLEYCRQHKPSKLVLMGPFVDEEHPKVASGLLDMTFEELFVSQVKDQIEEMLQAEGSGMHVVLLPSQRCVQHHPVFPQPPLEENAFEPPGAVRCLSNPATWSFGNTIYGATTTDVLRHMSSADIRRGNADRMSQLGGYLVEQRSFYPLYPPAPGVNYDSALATTHVSMPVVPDFLVVPSDLVPCAKVLPGPAGVDSTGTSGAASSGPVLVNPGRLSKGAAGGTFAHIYVQKPEAGISSFSDNVRVDIVRI